MFMSNGIDDTTFSTTGQNVSFYPPSKSRSINTIIVVAIIWDVMRFRDDDISDIELINKYILYYLLRYLSEKEQGKENRKKKVRKKE